jgi:hypothetical protein
VATKTTIPDWACTARADGRPGIWLIFLMFQWLAVILVLVITGLALVWAAMRRRHIDRWIIPYLSQSTRRRSPRGGEAVHLLLCIADHYEPHNGGVDNLRADQRVEAWGREYPRLFSEFRDADGHPPQHTFFYPLEQYNPAHVQALTELCAAGFGEVEVHLHHHDDTSENLRRTLLEYKTLISERHGLGARNKVTGELGYAFVHGDWALDNSRSDRQMCGVNNELDVLRETGCYVDMTLPSAPSSTQTRQINTIYYGIDDPARPKSHDRGPRVGTMPAPPRALMLIQGPLLLNWSRRRFGILPKIENGCIQNCQPPTEQRIDLWLKARVQVPSRPDWFFVKLHTHGAPEVNQRVLLGKPMQDFHQDLARRARANPNFHFHYVTARQMYNLARAAEAGWQGSVAEARDFELIWDPTIGAGGNRVAVGRLGSDPR